jgi:hypothetical protein
MKDAWTERWDERFKAGQFAYGTEPNNYLKERLTPLAPGAILFPAEGEGRNAVFAAGRGWKVSAFDISMEGRMKALRLAADKGVTIDYQVGELKTLPYAPAQFDALALIYAHFPAGIKSSMHRALDAFLKPGGYIIFEAFSKSHLRYALENEKVGGPKEIGQLFSTEEIASDFPNYDVVELAEREIGLSEGLFHNGTGSVIRFFGKKR